MKTKMIWILGILLVLTPLVSAANTYSSMFGGVLDLYGLLVENVFGSILLSGIGILAFIVFIGMISRMSPVALIWICTLFIVVFGSGYVGALVAVPAFIAVLLYFGQALLNLVNSYR